MDFEEELQGVDATPPAAPAVQHAEPQGGGSYTRNLVTGALSKARPEPVAQHNQE